MKNNTIANAVAGLIFVSILAVGAFSLVPFANAQEFDGGDYSGGCCDTGWSDVGSGYDNSSYGSDTGWYDVGSGYDNSGYNSSDTGWYDVGSGYTNPDYTSSSYGSSGYTSPASYGSSGYSASGYPVSGYSTGGYSYSVPAPHYSTTPSNVYAPTNTWDNGNTNIVAPTTVTTDSHNIAESSYCSGSSNCNTSTVTNNTWSPPAIVSTPTPVVYNYPAQPACYTCGCNTIYCQHPPVVYQQPAYNTATPYVSLTQVPYTGLDLGFWGTIAYWGFMVGFALVVAYLIAIKRVQNRIARSLKHFLFGSADEEEVVVAHEHAAPAAVARVTSVAEQTSSEDVIDSFILSQVNRTRHA